MFQMLSNIHGFWYVIVDFDFIFLTIQKKAFVVCS